MPLGTTARRAYCQVTHLSSDQGLEAGLEVVDAALVELGHLVQQLLVLGLKVVLDRPELLAGLKVGGAKGRSTVM